MSLEEFAVSLFYHHTMADHMEKVTGKRLGDGPYVSDIIQACNHAKEVMEANLVMDYYANV